MTRYQLRELVGQGGMGEVYAARSDDGRALVVKRLHKAYRDDRELAEQLITEGDMLGRVVHHNVVRVVDRGESREGPFLVMDRANGTTLSSVVDREGALPARRAFAIASQVLAGVAAIHDAGIVHGDLKSGNVLVGANDRVTIIDFGLAQMIGGERERDHMVSGTPAYMAPEVISGAPPSIVSDLYSVGIILYEMLTGQTPFAGATDILHAQQFERVKPPSQRATRSGVSRAIDRFVLRALAKAPAARFATVEHMARALDELAAAEWEVTTVQIAVTASAALIATDSDHRLHTCRKQIVSALDRAQQLIAIHRTAEAIAMLEHTLAALDPTGDATPREDGERWRIEMVLAALYDNLGKRQGARRLASLAFQHAQQTDCPTAAARTKALLDRLTGSDRLARGSGLFRTRTSG